MKNEIIVTLNCLADGYPIPQYEWYRGHIDSTFNAEYEFFPVDLSNSRYFQHGGDLVISRPVSEDSGSYFCKATNFFGTVNSNIMQLREIVLDRFEKRERPNVIAQGFKEAVINCLYNNKNTEDVNYIWFFNVLTQKVQQSRERFISRNGNLYFSRVTNGDAGNYICAVMASNPELRYVEMGSLDGKSVHEFMDESHFSPEVDAKKFHPTHTAEIGSCSGGLQTSRNIMFTLRNVVCENIKKVVFSSKLNLLMPFGPLAILAAKLTGHRGWVFILSLLGITPLAERLGYATEQLAFYTGPTVGGLLNATFGNATELIISIYALKRGLIRVVQQSLLGSVLSNMLLVLGCAFFCGGLVFHKKDQHFDKGTAAVSSGLLLMAVMGLLFPAVLHYTNTEAHPGKSEMALSRFSSCIMLVAYAAYLFFQLKGQKNQYVPLNEEGSQSEEALDDDEAPEISKWESIIWLLIMTAWISVLSEYLVDAIEGASLAWNIPIAFISVILLPIVGNAAEHASAIMFAMKDKLDISLGVAIGSSTQISMFGIPFCVVVGWIMRQPMDLNFHLFETATLFITVLVVAFLLQEGTSNYFKGLMLILCYLIVAASFFVHVDSSEGQF